MYCVIKKKGPLQLKPSHGILYHTSASANSLLYTLHMGSVDAGEDIELHSKIYIYFSQSFNFLAKKQPWFSQGGFRPSPNWSIALPAITMHLS